MGAGRCPLVDSLVQQSRWQPFNAHHRLGTCQQRSLRRQVRELRPDHPLSRALHASRGLTLIELMAVMFMMVILTATVLPSFVRARRDAQLRSSTRRLVAALNFARSLAVAERRPTRLAIDTARGIFSVAIQRQQESGEPQFVPEMSSLGRPQALPEGIQISLICSATSSSSPSADTDVVSFYEDGRADECVIQLRDRFGGERTIVVEPLTGRPRLGEGQQG